MPLWSTCVLPCVLHLTLTVSPRLCDPAHVSGSFFGRRLTHKHTALTPLTITISPIFLLKVSDSAGGHLVCLSVAINAWCLRRSHSFRHGWHLGASYAQVLLTYQQQREARLGSALTAQSKGAAEAPDTQGAILFLCHNIYFN